MLKTTSFFRDSKNAVGKDSRDHLLEVCFFNSEILSDLLKATVSVIDRLNLSPMLPEIPRCIFKCIIFVS